MVVFQALSWEARDVDDEYLISIFGRTAEGKSVCVTTVFKPYFFIKLDKTATEAGVRALWSKLGDAPESFDLVKSKDLWGFQNNEKFPYLQLFCKNLAARRMVSGRLRRPLPDETLKMKKEYLYLEK